MNRTRSARCIYAFAPIEKLGIIFRSVSFNLSITPTSQCLTARSFSASGGVTTDTYPPPFVEIDLKPQVIAERIDQSPVRRWENAASRVILTVTG